MERSSILTSMADSQSNWHDKYLLLCSVGILLMMGSRFLRNMESFFFYQNKFEKKCMSLAFIIRIDQKYVYKDRISEYYGENQNVGEV
jgi:hypothetical protein